jgi:hypothetical protein
MQVFFSIFWWVYFCVFFSGYPLMYVLVYLAHRNKSLHHSTAKFLFSMLPMTYAFVATCFWMLMTCTGKISFVLERIMSTAPSALAILYGFSALLFWLPAFRRKNYWSFLHSLALFMLPFINMLNRISKHKIVDHEYISNLIRIHAAGFIIYIVAIIFLWLAQWMILHAVSYGQHKHTSE